MKAVEKLLKSYIINNGRTVERTHELDVLLKIALEIDKSFFEIMDNCLILNKLLPNLKYSSKKIITKQDVNETITSLQVICSFPPLKTMRNLFSEKYKYEIVSEIVSN